MTINDFFGYLDSFANILIVSAYTMMEKGYDPNTRMTCYRTMTYDERTFWSGEADKIPIKYANDKIVSVYVSRIGQQLVIEVDREVPSDHELETSPL